MERSIPDRLRDAALLVALPTSLGLEGAVRLAEDLVAQGDPGEATLELASMDRSVTRRDGEAAVRSMLQEHGIDLPDASDRAGQDALLAHAFAFLGLPFEEFEGPFYMRLTEWDRQSEVDRLVVMTLVELDAVSSPSDRLIVQERLRLEMRQLLSGSGGP